VFVSMVCVRVPVLCMSLSVLCVCQTIDNSDFIMIVMEYAAGGELLEFINQRGCLTERCVTVIE